MLSFKKKVFCYECYASNSFFFLEAHSVFSVPPASMASAVTHFQPPIEQYGTVWFSCSVTKHKSALYLHQGFALVQVLLARGIKRCLGKNNSVLARKWATHTRGEGGVWGHWMAIERKEWPLTSSCTQTVTGKLKGALAVTNLESS